MSNMAKSVFFLVLYTIVVVMVTLLGVVNVRSDEATYRIQRELNAKGCHVGEPDGIHGEMTTRGLRCFQRREGLRVTGEPTGRTLARLFARDEPIEETEETAAPMIIDRRALGRCGERVVAIGKKRYGESRAKKHALEIWQTEVSDLYGTRFVTWGNVQDGRIECSPACATCKISYECKVSGIPCQE